MKLPEGQVIIGEFTIAQLDEPSGIYDEQTGRELSRLEEIRRVEKTEHGSQGVYLNRNGLISPEGNEINSCLARANPGIRIENASQYIVALVSQRPPTE